MYNYIIKGNGLPFITFKKGVRQMEKLRAAALILQIAFYVLAICKLLTS